MVCARLVQSLNLRLGRLCEPFGRDKPNEPGVRAYVRLEYPREDRARRPATLLDS